jgi:CheY-like chemotaxis protein
LFCIGNPQPLYPELHARIHMKKGIVETKRLNVILADDDDDDRYMFNEAIEELRLDIDTRMFKNGLELLQYLEQSDPLPDMIFLDLNMPVMDGLKCLKKIRETPAYKDISIIIYSTSPSETYINKTFMLGANIYLIKPDSFNELKDLLYKVILFNDYYRRLGAKKETFVMRLGSKSK